MRLGLEPGAVAVTVDDDGPGIPEAELERVLEPFRRLEDSRNRATGGVGLGLAIACRAVEAEGGTLVLSNRGGGGLRATVRLPRLGQRTQAGNTGSTRAAGKAFTAATADEPTSCRSSGSEPASAQPSS